MSHRRWEIRFSGFGGQGVITSGHIVGLAAVLHEGRDAILTKAYGPEQTGGWARADLVVDEEVDYPLVGQPDVLVALSQDGYERDGASLAPDGLLLYEAALVQPRADGREQLAVPALEAAEELGHKVVANTVLLGALARATGVVGREALLEAVLASVPARTRELNRRAFERGWELGSREAGAAAGQRKAPEEAAGGKARKGARRRKARAGANGGAGPEART